MREIWTWYRDGGSYMGEHPTREDAIREALSDEADTFYVGKLCDVDLSRYMLDAEEVREIVVERRWYDVGVEDSVARMSRNAMAEANEELRAWARKWLEPDPGMQCEGVRMTASEARALLKEGGDA